MRLALLCIAFALLALLAAPDAARAQPAPPKSVLLVLPEDPTYPASAALAQGLRSTVTAGWTGPVLVDVEHLDLSWIDLPRYQEQLRAFYLVKYGERRPDVLVVCERRAIGFLLDLRAALWPDVPIIFAAESERAAAEIPKEPRMTGVWAQFNVRRTVEAALELLPEARRVAVLSGAGGFDASLRRNAVAQLELLRDRLETIELTGLPIPELLQEINELPADTAVVYILYSTDNQGRRYTPRDALRVLAAEARRPIFITAESHIGSGAVGGALFDYERMGRSLGALTLRVLLGEPVESIPPGPLDAGVLAFDARALERWGIPESRVPPGAELRFREPSLWKRHRELVIAVALAGAILLAMVLVLLVERRHRAHAEQEARSALGQLAHVNRIAAMNELGSSIAHELNQPLAAIMANAEAARDLLDRDPPDLAEVRAALEDIVADDQRAGEVIRRIRSLLRKGEPQDRLEELSDLVREVARVVANDAGLRGAVISLELAPEPLHVRGDGVQLQQVVLNLVINALDAVSSRPEGERRVTLRTRELEDGRAELSVQDSGPGIAPEHIAHVFDAFFTTKPHGLGMGLSICRSIAEAHWGALAVESPPGGGAVFRLTLPAPT